ncbi:mannose-6-phosphate isomerase, class I [Nocardioides sp.]|uniref:mannose-6-phosphate isomerase, class I n=1 Tax=Nocardioides sp. TaxID=35761 RepID=UPI0037836AD6
MHRLTGETRNYAWGSRTLLPRFLGRDSDGDPHAELWVGAHPGDPARLADGTTLLDLLTEHPGRELGSAVADRFGGRLPFLMKALAAAEPLSLQVHPTHQRAEQGFARENGAGIAIGSPRRSYQDASHKPELIYAVTRFEGMAGFRDVDRSIAILELLGLPWADEIARDLAHGTPAEALHRVVSGLLSLRDPELSDALVDLAKAARTAEERSHRQRPPTTRHHRERTSVEREAVRVFAQAAALAERYPGDPGVLVTLLLNHVVLSPGEAMFLDAGVVHAYTSGFGVEIMASSDNVVRAGLTPKHVDVDELLEIADFTPMPPPLCPGRPVPDGLVSFSPPVEEFTLHVGVAPATALPATGPRIVLVLDGEVHLATAAERLHLTRGDAVFVGHDEGALEVTGTGRVAVGAVPG